MWSPARMGFLIVLSAALSLFQVAYVAIGVPISERASGLTSLSLALCVLLWIVSDARARGCSPCFDFGFLVGVFFPLSLVWYALWSRGAKGVLLLAGLFVLLILPSLTAGVIRLVVYGPD
jgi:hypothetical protein